MEFVQESEDIDVVHSVREPVRTALPWVVDADSLLASVQLGRFLALGLAARNQISSLQEVDIRRREHFMVSLYASPRCARIILRTPSGLTELLDHLTARGFSRPIIDALAGKAEIVYPSIPRIRRVVSASKRPTVLYMGRTPQDKGAHLVSVVFTQLHRMYGAAYRAIYVGPVPTDLIGPLAAADVVVHPILPRQDYLKLLSEADVFLSPTEYESVGIGLIEAAAAGAAIVCSHGPGMEHIDELFVAGENALFVSNKLSRSGKAAEYINAVSALLGDGSLRSRLSNNNLALTSGGLLSVQRRDEQLAAIYESARALGRLPYVPRFGTTDEIEAPEITDWTEQLCHWSGRRYAALVGGRVSL